MPIQWDREADAKLITALATTGIPDFEAVAQAMGEGVTVSAIKHRLVRIRDAARIPSAREAKKKDNSSIANPSTFTELHTSAEAKSPDYDHSLKSTFTTANNKRRRLKNPASTGLVPAGKGMKAKPGAYTASSVARSWSGKTVLQSSISEDESDECSQKIEEKDTELRGYDSC
ncbi:hypothetical protein N7507_010636 [Penicillium longicatenatum]|nr:hypothetical protein N7507_010636 [Penicillium longicatenatum]